MLKGLLESKGYHNLLDDEWTRNNSTSSMFMKQNAWAGTHLFDSVSTDLHDVITANGRSFLNTYKELGKTCGVLCMVTLATKIQRFHKLQYQPGMSIREHIEKFKATTIELRSAATTMPKFASMSSELIGVIFLNSFSMDESPTPLIQTVLNKVPFNYRTVYNPMSLEANRQEFNNQPTSLNYSQNKTFKKNPKGKVRKLLGLQQLL